MKLTKMTAEERDSLTAKIRKAHAIAGAPGIVTAVADERYSTSQDRPGTMPKMYVFPYSTLENGSVQVRPCWTSVEPDGSKRQHRRRVTVVD